MAEASPRLAKQRLLGQTLKIDHTRTGVCVCSHFRSFFVRSFSFFLSSLEGSALRHRVFVFASRL